MSAVEKVANLPCSGVAKQESEDGELDFDETQEQEEGEALSDSDEGQVSDDSNDDDAAGSKDTSQAAAAKKASSASTGGEVEEGELTDDDTPAPGAPPHVRPPPSSMGELPRLPQPAFRSRPPACKFFAIGRCTYGNDCKFAHIPGEMPPRPPNFPPRSSNYRRDMAYNDDGDDRPPRHISPQPRLVEPPTPPAAPVSLENVWERGVKQAKQLMQQKTRAAALGDAEKAPAGGAADSSTLPHALNNTTTTPAAPPTSTGKASRSTNMNEWRGDPWRRSASPSRAHRQRHSRSRSPSDSRQSRRGGQPPAASRWSSTSSSRKIVLHRSRSPHSPTAIAHAAVAEAHSRSGSYHRRRHRKSSSTSSSSTSSGSYRRKRRRHSRSRSSTADRLTRVATAAEMKRPPTQTASGSARPSFRPSSSSVGTSRPAPKPVEQPTNQQPIKLTIINKTRVKTTLTGDHSAIGAAALEAVAKGSSAGGSSSSATLSQIAPPTSTGAAASAARRPRLNVYSTIGGSASRTTHGGGSSSSGKESRRDELLRQLRAVEDAIAMRKRPSSK